MNEERKPLGEFVQDQTVKAMVAAQEEAQSLSQVYEKETGLRAFVQMIPIIGSSLDLVLSAPGAAAREERIWGFLQDLRDDLGHVDESKIDVIRGI